MKKLLIILFLIVPVFIGSSAFKFIIKSGKVTVSSNNKDSKIFVDNEEIGVGSCTLNVERGIHQVVLQTPGYKNTYYCLFSSQDATNLDEGNKINDRKEHEKFIEILCVKLKIKDKNKDYISEKVHWEKDIDAAIIAADKRQKSEANQEEVIELKNNKNKGASLNGEKTENPNDVIFIGNLYKTLKKSGFIDTVNKVFADNNNTLVLEGEVRRVVHYSINKSLDNYEKVKLDLVWYIENTYEEKIDSISTQILSGDFSSYSTYYQKYKSSSMENYESKMFNDAIEISYLNLYKDPTFAKYINQEKDFTISDPLLSLAAPKNAVVDKTDASLASVIVKTGRGHGSGFAITQNGFIITNYHVIAGKIGDKQSSIKIITANGDELEGKVVRYNKYRDLALIKVDKEFEKAFKLTNVKSFKNLDLVYTIGTPKSVELGQSVSSGVISNERKNNNNNLLQLGMSVNTGNSGGPVFDNNGILHGVIEAKLIGNNTEGVAFAIPAYLIQEYLNLKY